MPCRPLPLLLAPLLALTGLVATAPPAAAALHEFAHYEGFDPIGCALHITGKEVPGGHWLFNVVVERLCPALGAGWDQCSVTGSVAAGFSGPCVLSAFNFLTLAGTGFAAPPGGVATATTTGTYGACPTACYSFLATVVYNG